MEDHSESAMIALLPVSTEWCKIDLPHMTLVYAGEIPDLPEGTFNELAKAASSISMLAPPISLAVTGVEVFGDEEKVDVLRLETTPELLAMRKIVEPWNRSTYPFNPHCMIGPVGSLDQVAPTRLGFNRIYVGWGEQNLTFNLRR